MVVKRCILIRYLLGIIITRRGVEGVSKFSGEIERIEEHKERLVRTRTELRSLRESIET